MASLENRTGYWSISFRFGGKKFNRSLKTKDQDAAEKLKKIVETTIWRVKQPVIQLPEDPDVVSLRWAIADPEQEFQGRGRPQETQ